jgi:hypothetical protein
MILQLEFEICFPVTFELAASEVVLRPRDMTLAEFPSETGKDFGIGDFRGSDCSSTLYDRLTRAEPFSLTKRLIRALV